MNSKNVNKEKNIPQEELSWEDIDYDEVARNLVVQKEKERKILERQQIVIQTRNTEEDGNYFDKQLRIKNEKQQKQQILNIQKANVNNQNNYVQSFSHRDLKRIKNFTNCSSTFHNLLFETYGHFDKFIATHDEEAMPHENLVELLNIDISLLSIPFDSHANFLLKGICGIPSFWSQLLSFLKEFLNTKHKNLSFLLQVDMNTFFTNLEIMFHKVLVNDFMDSSMQNIFKELIKVLEDNSNITEWSKPARFLEIEAEYDINKNTFEIYDIYPTLKELNYTEEPLFMANVIDGEYKNVSHYLQVNLPLLKEDFTSRLRLGISEFKEMESITSIRKTPNIIIHPEVKIRPHNHLIAAKFGIHKIDSSELKNRFYQGQLLCFTTTKEVTDLVVAVVNHDRKELQEGFVSIELIRSENIEHMFDKEFFMFEPTTFFDPYFRVFNVLKNLNEANFPLADQILKVKDVDKFPTYSKRVNIVYNYQNFNFNINKKLEWPSPEKLYLEPMQLKAIQKAITSKFTIIQGPPGTGKTFIGLEILNILLNNTSETILVITQTNHTLDKFLLGAMQFTDNIVRLGKQSKCEELNQFALKFKKPSIESQQYYNKLKSEHRQEIGKLSTASTEKEFEEIREYSYRHNKMIEELNVLSSFSSINKKRIIGMTTSYAANGNGIVKMINAGIVIVEESADVLESHIIASLTNHTKQLILIGDHLQLRPLTNSYELTKKYHFNISLFERLIRNGLDFQTLDVQMRMSTEICNLVRGTTYTQLKDASNVGHYPEVKGTEKSLFCYNHKFPESEHGGETSKENKIEAEFIVKLCVYLVSSGNNASDITILTLYAAQAKKIESRLKNFSKEISNIKVAILDAFQGEENKIILLSLVRSNKNNNIGFLSDYNRISVILSRAQYGLFIIGNMDCLSKASNKWKKVRNILTEQNSIDKYLPINYKNNILKIKTPEEFPAI